MTLKLTYFKKSGKYYSEGEQEIPDGENIYLFDLWSDVKAGIYHPGLIGKWSNGFILVQCEGHPHDHPALLIV